MREIKFRGVSMGGHFVYGYLTKKLIRNSGEICWAIATGLKQSQVIPVLEDSIAQLVGHDKNGCEVYEGDELTDNQVDITGDKVTATLQPYIRHEKPFTVGEYFDRFWTKELVEDWEVKLKEKSA